MFPRDDSVVDSLIALQNTSDTSDSLGEDPPSLNTNDQNLKGPPSFQKLSVMLCAPTEDSTGIKRINDSEGDAYNLYVTNEMFDRIISNASNVDTNNDVYLSCQEVETKDGKLLMMASDEMNDESITQNFGEKQPCSSKLKTPLDNLIKLEDNSDEGNKEFPINYIEETILSPDILEKEANALHSTSEKLESKDNHCLLCDKTFNSVKSYRQHYTNFHIVNDKYAMHCWECKQNFKKVNAYIKHKVNVHANSDNLCTICGELLATARSLSNHLKSHINKQSYTCNTCGRAFRNQQSRQDHIRNKHLRPRNSVFVCKHCGSTFQHGRSLVRHVNCVHAKQRVVCPTCNKSYSSISSLYYHQRTIHENVAFHCGYCSMAFKSVSSVKKHENNMHHDVTRYRETPTEKVYNYNQFVTHQFESLKRKTTDVIRCLFCRTQYYSHEQYAKHYNKFHKEENVDLNLSSDQTDPMDVPGPSSKLKSIV